MMIAIVKVCESNSIGICQAAAFPLHDVPEGCCLRQGSITHHTTRVMYVSDEGGSSGRCEGSIHSCHRGNGDVHGVGQHFLLTILDELMMQTLVRHYMMCSKHSQTNPRFHCNIAVLSIRRWYTR